RSTTWACARARSGWMAWTPRRARANWPSAANAGGRTAPTPRSTCGASPTWPPGRRRRPTVRRTRARPRAGHRTGRPGPRRPVPGRASLHRVGTDEPPVPRLVHDAVRVAARVAHGESVRGRVPRQPVERGRGLERLLRRRLARRADVQRVAAMVLAEARRGVHRQDLGHREAARQLPFEDAQLVVVAAVARDRLQ